MIALSQKTLLNPFEKASISCTKEEDIIALLGKRLLTVAYLQ